MLEEFNKYVNNYDLTNKDIKLKYNHSIRVMNLSEKYAKLLNYSKEDIKLAKLIGLLHDIGRFEQLKLYDSYSDSKTIDHADYGVKVLFDDNLIEKFTNDEREKEIIKFAIKNHNKLSVPNISDERMLMHANLIRDVDKIDIIYLIGYLKEVNIKIVDDEISPKVREDFLNYKIINKLDIKNKNDEYTMRFCFPFDINNNICLKELKENLNYYYQTLNNEKIFKEILEETNKYIDERID